MVETSKTLREELRLAIVLPTRTIRTAWCKRLGREQLQLARWRNLQLLRDWQHCANVSARDRLNLDKRLPLEFSCMRQLRGDNGVG